MPQDSAPAQVQTTPKYEIYMEFMKENLNHARHVENERMMFNTLFAALVGGSFGMLSSVESPAVNLSVLALLLFLNIVCALLTSRWNAVFSEHNSLAKRAYDALIAECGIDDGGAQLYGFTHKKRTKLESFFYIHTSTFFNLFNISIMCLIILTFAYHVYISWDRLLLLFAH